MAPVWKLPQLLGLISLHVVFAFARFVSIVAKQVSRWFASPRLTLANPACIENDRTGRWKKTPQHLAVIFTPSKSIFPRIGKSIQNEEEREIEKVSADLHQLVKWCERIGVSDLTVYDESSILLSNAKRIFLRLSTDYPTLPIASSDEPSPSARLGVQPILPIPFHLDEFKFVGREVDSGCELSDVGSLPGKDRFTSRTQCGTSSSQTTPDAFVTQLTVTLLCRASGRAQLATVARTLAVQAQPQVRKDVCGIPVGDVVEAIETGSVSEPDLLIILGGPYLRLQGFPPWQLRLTEMYHHPSPSWLAPPSFTYDIFRKALDIYDGAEMRIGR